MPELQEALKSMWSQGSQMLVYIRGTWKRHLENFQNTECWAPLLKILISHVWNADWKSLSVKIDLDREGRQIGKLVVQSNPLILHVRI